MAVTSCANCVDHLAKCFAIRIGQTNYNNVFHISSFFVYVLCGPLFLLSILKALEPAINSVCSANSLPVSLTRSSMELLENRVEMDNINKSTVFSLIVFRPLSAFQMKQGFPVFRIVAFDTFSLFSGDRWDFHRFNFLIVIQDLEGIAFLAAAARPIEKGWNEIFFGKAFLGVPAVARAYDLCRLLIEVGNIYTICGNNLME